MAGANLQVRFGADTSGFLAQMRQMDADFMRVTRSVNSHGFALNKTQRALESFAMQATGSSRVLGTLSTTLLDFGAGGIATTGVLVGVGAIALAFDKLTESSTKAMEASDKLIETYLRAARVRALGVGGEQKASIEDLGKGESAYRQRAGFFTAAAVAFKGTGLDGIFGPIASGYTDKLVEATTTRQELVNQLGLAIGAANEKTAKSAKDAADAATAAWKRQEEQFRANARAVLGTFDSLKAVGVSSDTVNSALISSYDQVATKLREMGDVATIARGELLALQAAMMGNVVVAQHVAAINSTGSVGPLVGKTLPGMSLTPDLGPRDRLGVSRMPNVGSPSDPIVKIRDLTQDQLAADALHAQLVKDAIWGSASQLANVLVSALNVGGGGRGSQIGGSVGSTAGFAIGGLLGAGPFSPAGAAIGSMVGNFIGSAIGGLFDHHKKAVDQNTSAIEKLTEAMIQNSPSGFKIDEYRYDATQVRRRRPSAESGGGDIIFNGDVHFSGVQDLRDLGRQVRTAAARGGASPLTVSSG